MILIAKGELLRRNRPAFVAQKVIFCTTIVETLFSKVARDIGERVSCNANQCLITWK